MAQRFHPAWHFCTAYARELHARNCYQVMGYSLDTPAEFVVCWTRGGKPVGGTAQAIRIAMSKNIPVYNLAKEKDRDFWIRKIAE
jgi:hypothetical protein